MREHCKKFWITERDNPFLQHSMGLVIRFKVWQRSAWDKNFKIKMNQVKTHTYLVLSETPREGVRAAQKWAVGWIESDGHLGLTWSDKHKTHLSPVLKVSLHTYNSRAIYKLKTILGAVTRHENRMPLRLRSKLGGTTCFLCSKHAHYARTSIPMF